MGNLPARVQPKTEAIYLFYFSSFYVSPVVEARDVCGPMLAGTASLKRCPYFLRIRTEKDEEESG